MDKKNIIIAGIIFVAILVSAVILGKDEIYGMIQMVYVEEDTNIPKAESGHVTVLSGDGYDTENENFRVINGKLYVAMEYVNEQYASGRFFFDSTDGIVIYTDSVQIMNCSLGSSYSLKQKQSASGAATFVYVASENGQVQTVVPEDGLPEGGVFINAQSLEELYGIQFQYISGTNVLILEERMMRYVDVVSSEDTQYLKVNAKKGTILQSIIGMNEGFEVYRELTPGETLIYYGEEEDYYKVADVTGVVGYVEKTAVGDIRYQERQSVVLDTYEMPEQYRADQPISLVWHYFSPGYAYMSSEIEADYEGAEGALSVLAPTWMHVWQDDDGNAMVRYDISQDYIDWAHSKGYQVWVTLENVDNTFSNIDDILYELLSVTETRQALVQEVLSLYQEYGFDGFNVDLESLEERVGPYFVQFMRELSAVLRPAGCLLSTDLGVPTAWTEHYDRETMGQVCDYVCLMAYDEHYAADTTAGSVASYPWVQAGVRDSLTEGIPAEKLVLCMPLYVRVWWLNSANEVMESESLGMADAWTLATDNWGVEPTWEQESGQYYAEILYGDGTVRRAWLEDTRSMQLRIDLAADQKLGGVALWFHGYETQELFEQLRTYRNANGN